MMFSRKVCNFWIVLFFGTNFIFPQTGFLLEDKKDKVRFELVKNLPIVPVVLNGVELSFLLDTGVKNTILFSLEERDTLELYDAKSINLRGLGQGNHIVAFKSDNNRFRIGEAVNKALSIYVIFDKGANFSSQLGIPVHGIIGYDFFKDFVVEINYRREFIKFYDSDEVPKCRGCERLPLFFFNHKPYLKTVVNQRGNQITRTLLIDSGASDALWLFPDEKIKVPSDYFVDFLGLGLSGAIYGKRGKVDFFSMGKYTFEHITTAFPDSMATQDFKAHILKDGLIGGEILKRFKWVIDYRNKQLFFEPNVYFDDAFHYDMSGLVLRHNGLQVVREYELVGVGVFEKDAQSDFENNSERTTYNVQFSLLPQLEIAEIRPESPAFRAGLHIGDVILKVNGRESHRFSLFELADLFSSEVGKKIKIEFKRNGQIMKCEFLLEKVL